MEKKLTKKDLFGALLELEQVNTRTDLVEFINHELELLERKSNSGTKTKTQIENDSTMVVILETLKDNARPMSITEIQSANETLKELSNQKISALLKKLVDNKQVERIADKKKTLFQAI